MTVAPLPKFAGVIALLTALGTGLASLAGVVPPKYALAVTCGAVFVSAFSHSLNGNGTYIPPKP